MGTFLGSRTREGRRKLGIWIPYILDNTYTSEFESVADIYNTSVNPSAADLAASPPAYSTLLEVDLEPPLLSFARNKTIVLIGDSHDRKNLQSLCSRVPGAIEHGTDGHHIWTCSLPSLGTHFVLLFHYGLMREEETYRAPHDQLPNLVEQRVDQVLLSMLQGLSPSVPSLVIFQSGFWDLRYWGMRALAEGANEPGRLAEGIVSIHERPLLWSELRWYRQRFGDVLGALQKTFPNSQIMTRTIQSYRGNEHARNVAIFELKESIKAMSRLYLVPTMRCECGELSPIVVLRGLIRGVDRLSTTGSELLQGSVSYADDQHFEIGGLPYKLWISGALLPRQELERLSCRRVCTSLGLLVSIQRRNNLLHTPLP
ncbi:BQ5605_C003g02105 [Microbotryum silenes-dioicae]|uniref:BQ5605_C003g02105 protein n=1 Tax=Microbotryum silenes-dioicae TaxID=796604 RepID=A0A2X0M0U6_9BASI|nr:BQ5605_C003g02105 [Microbotryum silenes-dioicae]